MAPEAPQAGHAAARATGAAWRKVLPSAMPRMYALESRLMFDAAAVDTVLDAATHNDTHLATLAPRLRARSCPSPRNP